MPCVKRQIKRSKPSEHCLDVYKACSWTNTDDDNPKESKRAAQQKFCHGSDLRKATGPDVARAEKSRCAAKLRRDQEQEEFKKLMEILPFPNSALAQLDKAAILKLAVCYLQMKEFTKQDGDCILKQLNACQNGGYGVDMFGQSVESSNSCGQTPLIQQYQSPALCTKQINEGKLMLNALNGLVLVVDGNGCILYVSENSHKIMGFRQTKMIGQSALDFIHPDDHREFVKQFCFLKPQQKQPSYMDQPMEMGNDDLVDPVETVQRRSFYIRMKCFLRQRGSKIHQFGHFLTQWSGKLRLGWEDGEYRIMGLIATVRPIHSVPIMEFRLEDDVFISRHGLDMSFTFCDPRILNLAGYEPVEVIGKSAYQFHNPLDAPKVHHCHRNLIKKGTSVSRYYRFLGKLGHWIWMKTRATIITDTNNQPQYVVCQNYVYSDEVCKDEEQDASDPCPLSPYQECNPCSAAESTNYSNNNNTENAASSSSHPDDNSRNVSYTSCPVSTSNNILPLDTSPMIASLNVSPMLPAFVSNIDMMPLCESSNADENASSSFSVSDLPQMLDSLPDDLMTPLDVSPSMLPSPSSSSGYESEMNDGTNLSESSHSSNTAAASLLSPVGGMGITQEFNPFPNSRANENPQSPSTSLSSMLDSDDCISPPVWNTGVNQQTELKFDQANHSLRDHSYMAPQHLPRNIPVTSTASSISLISGEFDPSGLSLDANTEFDWLDEVSESLMNSQSSLLSWQDDLAAIGNSSTSSCSIFTDSVISSQVSDPLAESRARYRLVASDHDYSAKPTDEPVSVKAAIPAAYSDNFSDSMNDVDLLNDSHLGSSYNMADVSGYQRTSVQSSTKLRTGASNSRTNSKSASHSETILGALLGSSGKAAAYRKRSANPIVSRSNCMPPRRAISSSMSVGMFPSNALSTASSYTGRLSQSTQEFAYKFADNMAEQQMRLQMLSYLAGDEVDSDNLDLRSCLRPSKRVATVSRAPPSQQSARTLGYTGRNSKETSNAAFHRSNQPGAKSMTSSHSGSRYTVNNRSAAKSTTSCQQASRNYLSNQPSVGSSKSGMPVAKNSSNSQSLSSRTGHSGHKQSNSTNRTSSTNSRSRNEGSHSSKSRHVDSTHHATSMSDTQGSSLLEKFLLCSQKLNPNAGSDEVFPEKKVTEQISQLDISDNGNLLKQLLTGEIDNEHMHQYETSVIANRKCSDAAENSDSEEAMNTDGLSQSEPPGQDLGFDLFDPSAAMDMDTLLAPLNSDVDMVMESNLNDILREQMRHEDLWMQEYFKNL